MESNVRRSVELRLDAAIGAMVIGELFLVPPHLSVDTVGEKVDRGIHVVMGSDGEQVGA